ncbi:MAG: S-layer protein [Herbinix sp.]|nr:S-layer protein [Herbinix sp.]
MKKILCFVITATLLLTSTTTAFAKQNHGGEQYKYQTTNHHNQSFKASKLEFKINSTPVIKYGKMKLPIKPITQGMGATVTFDKATATLTVVKGSITIVINFKNETVTVNGVADANTGIFKAKNSKKMTVLIKYIANALGVRTTCDKDKVIVEVPGLDLPTNVTVTPVSSSAISNTLNSSTLYMTASANIKPGQATGGKAELYVGSKLVAVDNVITATDSAIQFTTSDETPTNAELQAAVPTGGLVTVKLYNASNNSVTSSVANPTLKVDYVAPTITGITSAIYNVAENKFYLSVTGAGAVGDIVDVTRISLYDAVLAKTYQLTNTTGTGSNGVVTNASSLVINIGAVDKLGLADFGNTSAVLTLSVGSLLTDAAGNTSPSFTTTLTIPVIIIK